MRRRTFLCSLGVGGLSGCLTTVSTTQPTKLREVSVTEVRGYDGFEGLPQPNIESFVETFRQKHDEEPFFASPDDYALQTTIDIREPTVTTEQTARVRVTVTNKSDQRVEFRSRQGQLVPNVESFDDSKLVLVPADNQLEKVARDCWQPKTSVVFVPETKSLVFEPGEREQVDLELWSSDHDDGCLPPGDYLFLQEYNDPDRGTVYPNRSDVHWSFTLTVERALEKES